MGGCPLLAMVLCQRSFLHSASRKDKTAIPGASVQDARGHRAREGSSTFCFSFEITEISLSRFNI